MVKDWQHRSGLNWLGLAHLTGGNISNLLNFSENTWNLFERMAKDGLVTPDGSFKLTRTGVEFLSDRYDVGEVFSKKLAKVDAGKLSLDNVANQVAKISLTQSSSNPKAMSSGLKAIYKKLDTYNSYLVGLGKKPLTSFGVFQKESSGSWGIRDFAGLADTLSNMFDPDGPLAKANIINQPQARERGLGSIKAKANDYQVQRLTRGLAARGAREKGMAGDSGGGLSVGPSIKEVVTPTLSPTLESTPPTPPASPKKPPLERKSRSKKTVATEPLTSKALYSRNGFFGGPLGAVRNTKFGFDGEKHSGKQASAIDFWEGHYQDVLGSHSPLTQSSLSQGPLRNYWESAGISDRGFRSGSALFGSRQHSESPKEKMHREREAGRLALYNAVGETDKSISSGSNSVVGPSAILSELKQINASTKQQVKLTEAVVNAVDGDVTKVATTKTAKKGKSPLDLSDDNMSKLHAAAKQSGDFSDFDRHLKARRTADKLGKADHWSELLGGGGGPGGPGDKKRNRRQGFLNQVGTQFRHAAIWQAYSPIFAVGAAAAYGTVQPYETMEAIKYGALGATAGEQAVALGLGSIGHANNPFRRSAEAINTSRMILGGVGWAPTIGNQVKASELGELVEHVARSSDIEPKALTQMVVRNSEVFKNTNMSQEELMTRTMGSIHRVGQLTSVKGPELQQALAFGGPTLSQLFSSGNPGDAIGFLTPFIAAGATNAGRAITHMTSSNTLEKLALSQVQAMVNASRMEQAGEDNAKYALDEKEIKKMVEGKNAKPEIRKLFKETLGEIADQMKTPEGLTGVLARHGAQVMWGIGASIDVPHADENVTRMALLANSLYSAENIGMTQQLSHAARAGFDENAAQSSLDNQQILNNAATNFANIITDFGNILKSSSWSKEITASIQRATGPASYMTNIDEVLDNEDATMAEKKKVIDKNSRDWNKKIAKGHLRPNAEGFLPEDLINDRIKAWAREEGVDASPMLLDLPEGAKNRKWIPYPNVEPGMSGSVGGYVYSLDADADRRLRPYIKQYRGRLLREQASGFTSGDNGRSIGDMGTTLSADQEASAFSLTDANRSPNSSGWYTGQGDFFSRAIDTAGAWESNTIGGVLVSTLKSLKDALIVSQAQTVHVVTSDGSRTTTVQQKPPEATATTQFTSNNHVWNY